MYTDRRFLTPAVLIATAVALAGWGPAARAADDPVRDIGALVADSYAKLEDDPEATGAFFATARADDATLILLHLGRYRAGWAKFRAAARAKWRGDLPVPAAFQVARWPVVPPVIDAKSLRVDGNAAWAEDEDGEPVARFRRARGAWRWDADAQFGIDGPGAALRSAQLFAAYAAATEIVGRQLARDAYASAEDVLADLERATCCVLVADHLTDSPRLKDPPAVVGEQRVTSGLGRVTALAMSPDGAQFAVGAVAASHAVRLRPTTGAGPTFALDVPGYGLFDVHKLTYSPDGKRLAVLGAGYRSADVCRTYLAGTPKRPYEEIDRTFEVCVFEAKDGQPVAAYRPRGAELTTEVRFSPDGTHVAFGGTGTYVYEVATCKPAYAGPTSCSAVGFATDGSLLAFRPNDQLDVVDWRTGRALRRFRLSGAHMDRTTEALVVPPDGESVIYGSLGGAIQIDLKTGKEFRRFRLPALGGINRVNALALSPDGEFLAGVSGLFYLDDPNAAPLGFIRTDAGRDVCLWDARTGRLVRRFRGHAKAVSGAVFLDGGKSIVSASTDGTLRAWDPAAAAD